MIMMVMIVMMKGENGDYNYNGGDNDDATHLITTTFLNTLT